jgi:threonine dehydrogenase-like Zn-dependent dehydrogenase
MKAVVYHGVGDIRLEKVSDPKLKESIDAIVRMTASAICGTYLHFVRGTVPGVEPGTILGHEGVGVVEEVGKDVRNVRVGDRVVIPSTIAFSSLQRGPLAQCDRLCHARGQGDRSRADNRRRAGSQAGCRARGESVGGLISPCDVIAAAVSERYDG